MGQIIIQLEVGLQTEVTTYREASLVLQEHRTKVLAAAREAFTKIRALKLRNETAAAMS